MGYKKTKYSKFSKAIDKIISPNDYYQTQWCVVDIDNMFTYEGVQYQISKKVKQYIVTDIPELNQADMDKILVIEQYGVLHFYDQDVNSIKNSLITVIK